MCGVVSFIKKHPFLTLGTLGLAAIGFLGYRLVKWIIEKCARTLRIDNIAQQNLSAANKPSASQLTNHVFKNITRDLTPDMAIENGFGEFVVYQRDGTEVTQETFDKAYDVFLKYSPLALAEQNPDAYDQRQLKIQEEVQKISPDLEVAFVPRTLYELTFIRAGIEEEVKRKSGCQGPELAMSKSDAEIKRELTELEQKGCWHFGVKKEGDSTPGTSLRRVAHKLNALVVQKLSIQQQGPLTYQRITNATEEVLNFLQKHYKKCQANDPNYFIPHVSLISPPATNFGSTSTRASIKPMCIVNDDNAQIVRNAVALECSEVARNSLLLYRGSSFSNDIPYQLDTPQEPYSLSFGASLFAGMIYDGAATAFHYMRKENADAYALAIPVKELVDAPFMFPKGHAIMQLHSRGEHFHGRTKAWRGATKVAGYLGLGTERDPAKIKEHYGADMDRDAIVNGFMRFKSQAIRLNA